MFVIDNPLPLSAYADDKFGLGSFGVKPRRSDDPAQGQLLGGKMGDMADYVNSNMPFTPWEDGEGDEPYIPSIRYIQCKYCKMNKLTWKQDKEKWRLYDVKGILHSCLEGKR